MAQEHPFPSGNRHSAIGNGPYTGPTLTPSQYEALCRHALCREYGIPMGDIKTGYLESPTKIRHQIDLYWTIHDGVCNFLCFANAKFLKTNVDLGDIMTLLGVQRDIRAHKAMMITNTGYSITAVLLAQENGIALLIVRPALTLDVASLPKSTAPTVARALEKLSPGVPPVYDVNIVHRGFDPSPNARTEPGRGASPRPRVSASPCLPRRASIPNKMIASPPPTPRAPSPFGIRRK